MDNIVVLSTAYLGPVQYYSKILKYKRVIVECNDNYIKQTYRNRCVIGSANGPQTLSIPVVHNHGLKCKVKDIRISYDTPWQKIHWKAIESAYNNSPFYEYYIDDLKVFFFSKHDFLLDFNMKITDVLCRSLGIKTSIEISEDFYKTAELNIPDFREIIHPKIAFRNDESFVSAPYYQVFETKHGFIPNLSVIDLLFNNGPEAVKILSSTLRN